jgi:hypothetical protein
MRVMVMVKATANSEAGVMPDEKMLTEMGKFNEELVKAGVIGAGEGLHPSVKGKRVRFSGGKKAIVDGPFPETKELIAGFWLWEVKSMDEALEWARRCPDPMPGEESELELRPVFGPDDFGEALTPELREAEARLRAESAKKGLFGLSPAIESTDQAGRFDPPDRFVRVVGDATPSDPRAVHRVGLSSRPVGGRRSSRAGVAEATSSTRTARSRRYRRKPAVARLLLLARRCEST